MSKDNDGPYRLVCVGNTGVATRRRIEKWSNVMREFNALKRLPHIRYAAIIEIGEDIAFNGIKEEYYAGK